MSFQHVGAPNPFTHRLPNEIDIEEFVSANGVDEAAAQELRDCTPEIWRKVLLQGDLSRARNASALLLSRIRDAHQDASAGSTASDEDVEKFIQQYMIDDEAAGHLRSCSYEVKKWVLGQGGLGSARSPSAIVLARIRDARRRLEMNNFGMPVMGTFGRGGGQQGFQHPQMMSGAHGSGFGAMAPNNAFPHATKVSSEEIEEFLRSSNLNERAIEEFRSCPFDVQQLVVARGELATARNPSATLLSRISRIRETMSRKPWQQFGPAGPAEWQVEAFLAEAAVDERAIFEFRALSPDLQGRVMSKGEFMTAKNPSAVLLARIKDARAASQFSPMTNFVNPGAHMSPEETRHMVELYLAEQNVDDKAKEVLRQSPIDVQQLVLSRGEVNTARNPSAALLTRVKEEEQKRRMGSTGAMGMQMSGHGFQSQPMSHHMGMQHNFHSQNIQPNFNSHQMQQNFHSQQDMAMPVIYSAPGGTGYQSQQMQQMPQSMGMQQNFHSDMGSSGFYSGHGGTNMQAMQQMQSAQQSFDHAQSMHHMQQQQQSFDQSHAMQQPQRFQETLQSFDQSQSLQQMQHMHHPQQSFGHSQPTQQIQQPQQQQQSFDHSHSAQQFQLMDQPHSNMQHAQQSLEQPQQPLFQYNKDFDQPQPTPHMQQSQQSSDQLRPTQHMQHLHHSSESFPQKRGFSDGPAQLMQATQLVHWITLNANSPLESAGWPGEAPVVHYNSDHQIFMEAERVLSNLIADLSTEIELREADQYPEIRHMINIDGTNRPFLIAAWTRQNFWGVGVGTEYQERRSAALLALTVALSLKNGSMDPMREKLPAFDTFCQAAGLVGLNQQKRLKQG